MLFLNFNFKILLILLTLIFFYREAVSQPGSSNLLTAGVNYTTVKFNNRNLEFKPGIKLSFQRSITFNRHKIYIGLEYIRKGANWSFYTADSIHKETHLYENQKLLDLHYLGLPITTTMQLFRSRFYLGFNLNLNYLFYGNKYDYDYNMLSKQLTVNAKEIQDNNSNPFIYDKARRVETAFGLQIMYKPKLISHSYFNLGYEKGLTSILTVREFRNSQLYLSYSYLF